MAVNDELYISILRSFGTYIAVGEDKFGNPTYSYTMPSGEVEPIEPGGLYTLVQDLKPDGWSAPWPPLKTGGEGDLEWDRLAYAEEAARISEAESYQGYSSREEAESDPTYDPKVEEIFRDRDGRFHFRDIPDDEPGSFEELAFKAFLDGDYEKFSSLNAIRDSLENPRGLSTKDALSYIGNLAVSPDEAEKWIKFLTSDMSFTNPGRAKELFEQASKQGYIEQKEIDPYPLGRTPSDRDEFGEAGKGGGGGDPNPFSATYNLRDDLNSFVPYTGTSDRQETTITPDGVEVPINVPITTANPPAWGDGKSPGSRASAPGWVPDGPEPANTPPWMVPGNTYVGQTGPSGSGAPWYDYRDPTAKAPPLMDNGGSIGNAHASSLFRVGDGVEEAVVQRDNPQDMSIMDNRESAGNGDVEQVRLWAQMNGLNAVEAVNDFQQSGLPFSVWKDSKENHLRNILHSEQAQAPRYPRDNYQQSKRPEVSKVSSGAQAVRPLTGLTNQANSIKVPTMDNGGFLNFTPTEEEETGGYWPKAGGGGGGWKGTLAGQGSGANIFNKTVSPGRFQGRETEFENALFNTNRNNPNAYRQQIEHRRIMAARQAAFKRSSGPRVMFR
jgi:hypothetical protein